MKAVQRARMAGIVTAMAAVIGGTGFAVGTLTAEPPAATARAGDAARSGAAPGW